MTSAYYRQLVHAHELLSSRCHTFTAPTETMGGGADSQGMRVLLTYEFRRDSTKLNKENQAKK
jgi:hypothetical protein